jgi:hypothetical protein
MRSLNATEVPVMLSGGSGYLPGVSDSGSWQIEQNAQK